MLCYNADEPTERYNAADTVKIQNMIFLTTGGCSSPTWGGCSSRSPRTRAATTTPSAAAATPETNRARYGEGDYQHLRNGRHRDARTNFLYALGRHGLGPRDVMPNLNFFTRVRVAAGGALDVGGQLREAGCLHRSCAPR